MKGINGDTAQTPMQHLSFVKLVYVRVQRVRVWQQATRQGYTPQKARTLPLITPRPGNSRSKRGSSAAYL
eukprot:5383792-Karenia_brevis.AAC.1